MLIRRAYKFKLIVAAKNISAAGLAAIACQARNSGRQQEPVGNREVCLPCAG